MTVALLPSLVTAITSTVAVGVAAARPIHVRSAITATTTAADRHLRATAVAIAAPITTPVCVPSAGFSARMAPATPTATVKSP